MIGEPAPLIAGLDSSKVNECKQDFSGEAKKGPGFPAEIRCCLTPPFSLLLPLPLVATRLIQCRVGKVVAAEEHSQADHLYILKVDLGKEQRTVVSGLRGAYRDKDLLLGKLVLVLSNLKDSKFKASLLFQLYSPCSALPQQNSFQPLFILTE